MTTDVAALIEAHTTGRARTEPGRHAARLTPSRVPAAPLGDRLPGRHAEPTTEDRVGALVAGFSALQHRGLR